MTATSHGRRASTIFLPMLRSHCPACLAEVADCSARCPRNSSTSSSCGRPARIHRETHPTSPAAAIQAPTAAMLFGMAAAAPLQECTPSKPGASSPLGEEKRCRVGVAERCRASSRSA
uniref:Uncharacterized protein n=1 Tax=Ixodes ricinus TaxID=34613 RepID=A0A6B0ULQ6_IXORI